METGEDEEDDELSQLSMNEAVHNQLKVQLRTNKPDRQTPNSRAPTMTIDIVRIGRPLKVLSLLLTSLSLLLFTVGALSTSWIGTGNKWIGIYQQCLFINELSGSKDINEVNNCDWRNYRLFNILGCMILNITAILCTIIGLACLICGILSLIVTRKRHYYISAIVTLIFAILVMTSCIVIIIMCNYYTPGGINSNLYVGWSLITSAAGVVTLCLALIFLIYDKDAEEIEYRETIHRDCDQIEEAA